MRTIRDAVAITVVGFDFLNRALWFAWVAVVILISGRGVWAGRTQSAGFGFDVRIGGHDGLGVIRDAVAVAVAGGGLCHGMFWCVGYAIAIAVAVDWLGAIRDAVAVCVLRLGDRVCAPTAGLDKAWYKSKDLAHIKRSNYEAKISKYNTLIINRA